MGGGVPTPVVSTVSLLRPVLRIRGLGPATFSRSILWRVSDSLRRGKAGARGGNHCRDPRGAFSGTDTLGGGRGELPRTGLRLAAGRQRTMGFITDLPSHTPRPFLRRGPWGRPAAGAGAQLPASCGSKVLRTRVRAGKLQLPECPAPGDHDSQSAPRARGLQMGARRASPPVSRSRSDPASGHGQAWRARADWRHRRRVGYGGRQGAAAAVGLGSRGGTAGLGRGEPGGLRLGRGEVRAGS